MNRPTAVALGYPTLACGLLVLMGCRAETLSFSAQAVMLQCGDAGLGLPGPIGTPCGPNAIERDPTFTGYDKADLEVSTCTPPVSGAPVCLTYHFQGRATCPYGQDASGVAPPGASPCETSDGHRVSGAVAAQCADRPPSKEIFWSCRCANVDGRTDDGASYCSCPSGTSCQSTFLELGLPDAAPDVIGGAYCIPGDVVFDPSNACQTLCDPTAHPCP